MPDDSFFANRPKKQQSLVGVPSGSLPRSPVSFSFSNVSLQIIIRSPHPRLGKFVFSDPKRVLQHYRHFSGIPATIGDLCSLGQSRHGEEMPPIPFLTRNAMQSMRGAGYGKVVTLSLGGFALASEKVGSRATVLTMRTRIHKSKAPDCSGAFALEGTIRPSKECQYLRPLFGPAPLSVSGSMLP